MVLINPKQVEWLVVNQPETEHLIEENDEWNNFDFFEKQDIVNITQNICTYWLLPKTYNSLPTIFKQLADA
jgi:hypothetical protein